MIASSTLFTATTAARSATNVPRTLLRLMVPVVLMLLCLIAMPAALLAAPAADPNDVQTVWRLLDYMAVDYGGAVEGGRVKSASEYAEMTEFAASVSSRLATLPPKPERAALLAGLIAIALIPAISIGVL